jgi:beta-galactosidase
MATSRRTWFDERGLIIAAPVPSTERSGEAIAPDARLELYVGSMHYWRTPAASWSRCLAGLRALGLTAVESYVPWRIHEPSSGRFDWSGDRDLRGFLELAAEHGLAVLLRVGPNANAELTGLGFPDDILQDSEIAARTSHGSIAWLPAPPRSVPLPSYSSSKFHRRVQRWYQAIAGQLEGLCSPAGPVVALGIDNEAQLFFRRGAYDLDYHPEAIARWAELHPHWPEPPRSWALDDAARCLAWVRFKQHSIEAALGRFGAALDAVGLDGLARFHNLPLVHRDARGIAVAIGGVVAVDCHGLVHPSRMRREALRVLGDLSPLPLVLECGVGDVPWLPPAGDARADCTRALTLLAAGARGLGFYMAVERERWAGGLLESDGTPAVGSEWAGALLRALREVDWPALRRRPAVAVVNSSTDATFAEATCLLDPWSPVASELLGLGAVGHAGLAAPGAELARRWQRAVEQALEWAGVPYGFVDETATADELARYRAVIAPLGERVARGLWQTLREVAQDKRSVVVIGPSPPSRDQDDQPLDEPPLRPVGKMRAGSLDDLDGLASDLAQLGGAQPWRSSQRACVLSLAWDEQARPRVLFVFNDGDAAMTTDVTADIASDVASVRDAITGERILARDGALQIAVPATSVRMFVIEI